MQEKERERESEKKKESEREKREREKKREREREREKREREKERERERERGKREGERERGKREGERESKLNIGCKSESFPSSVTLKDPSVCADCQEPCNLFCHSCAKDFSKIQVSTKLGVSTQYSQSEQLLIIISVMQVLSSKYIFPALLLTAFGFRQYIGRKVDYIPRLISFSFFALSRCK